MRLVVWLSVAAVALIACHSTSPMDPRAVNTEAPTFPLCELLQNQLKYAGKAVSTTARIASFKEVTGIWDPACPRLGADLHTADSARSNPSIIELDDTLRKHGMGDYPVIANLTGILLLGQWEEHSFLPQPRLVFLVSSASNIHRSSKIERR